MLTIFNQDGTINEGAIRKMVSMQISGAIDGIFPVSTVGEFVHLDLSERKYLIDIVFDEVAGRVPVIPGCGATCLTKSIEIANYASEKGCAGVVLMAPYFYKTPKDLIEKYILSLANCVDINIYLYNIPFFSNEIPPDLVERVCSHPRIVGIKDSSGSMINIANLIDMTKKIKPDFKVLTGAEETIFSTLVFGGDGCMTAAAGIIPELLRKIFDYFYTNQIEESRKTQLLILKLIRLMKAPNFPIGYKLALETRGIPMGHLMQPPNKSQEQLINRTREEIEIEMEKLLTDTAENVISNQVQISEEELSKIISKVISKIKKTGLSNE